jgi:hypothetical protein
MSIISPIDFVERQRKSSKQPSATVNAFLATVSPSRIFRHAHAHACSRQGEQAGHLLRRHIGTLRHGTHFFCRAG